ncbi:hypothetical protein HMP06_0398 [Sphingomonas sp. HMP6]|nr:hypothetical protein HMP06_0398 [Sphingomonas sp. HMP6]
MIAIIAAVVPPIETAVVAAVIPAIVALIITAAAVILRRRGSRGDAKPRDHKSGGDEMGELHVCILPAR